MSKLCLVAVTAEAQRHEISGHMASLGFTCIPAGTTTRVLDLLGGGYDVVVLSHDLCGPARDVSQFLDAIRDTPVDKRPQLIYFAPEYASSALDSVTRHGGTCISNTRSPTKEQFVNALRTLSRL